MSEVVSLLDGRATIHVGDVRESLRAMEAGSVQCCVTSPPYWSLRDYGTATWEGGSPECEHTTTKSLSAGHACIKCGALRVDRQIGLESTPEAYVQTMVDVFREVRRVLRDDGTVFLNLGDSYCNTDKWGGGTNGNTGKHTVADDGSVASWAVRTRKDPIPGIKPKDLCMIPWRVALALQADGWFLRSVIVWHKKAPMPESVTDRPTSSWEPIFLLAKQDRYFYDAEAVKEIGVPSGWNRQREVGKGAGCKINGLSHDPLVTLRNDADRTLEPTSTRNQRNVWTLGPEPYSEAHFATFPTEIPRRAILAGTSEKGCCPKCGAGWARELERTSMVLARSERTHDKGQTRTSGTMLEPPTSKTVGWSPACGCAAGLSADDLELVETPTGERVGDDPSVLTGRAGMNRPRGENEGTSPMTRYEQRQYAAQIKASAHKAAMATEAGPAFAHYIRTDRSGARPVPPALLAEWIERGWLSRVEIPAGEPLAPVPCVVLDPFLGSGTTLAVAAQLGRRGVGCELNPAYVELARDRIGKAARPHTHASTRVVDAPLFVGGTTE